MNTHYMSLAGWGAGLLLFGYFLPFIRHKRLARILAWSLILLTTLFSIHATASDSPLFRMIAIVSLQLLSMKLIVLVETYAGKPGLSFPQWLAFAQGWFGMRPLLFERLVSKPLNHIRLLVWKGFSRIGLGLSLLLISRWMQSPEISIPLLPDLLMLAGLSLVLHFGILNISTGFWRFFGVDVKELFRSPYQAKSMKEFWGRRWNLAFSEMTALVAYRPLKEQYGSNQAMLASFLLSGLLHEIAISFPVKSGYGLPFLYFVLHAVAMEAEGKIVWVKRIINHPILSRLWVFCWLILPLPLLFHQEFILQVVVPLRNILLRSIGL